MVLMETTTRKPTVEECGICLRLDTGGRCLDCGKHKLEQWK